MLPTQNSETRTDPRALWTPIDRYQPCFELASGGMATVYLARVTARAGFDRFVALKRIHPHLIKEPGFVEMFLDEANVASRIVHPNVCSVFDYEAEGERHYIAMEYLMGESLSRVSHAMQTEKGTPPPQRMYYLVARAIADACEGLHAAHELRGAEGKLLNLVHRDVSPQNLFLTYDGAVKVVDFGLVRTAQCLHKTKTGIVKGKFAYLAPEALSNQPVDRRVDIWGLGVVLWELVTRRPLFLRESEADTVLAVASAKIPAPSEVCPGIPPELDRIVMKALARNQEDRYPTAREMGRDLMRFIHSGAEPVGLSDLAEWMDQLFPGGRARKLQLLEMAGQLGSDVPTLIAARMPSLSPPAANVFSIAETRLMQSPILVPKSTRSRRLSITRLMPRTRWPAITTTSLVALGAMSAWFGLTAARGPGTSEARASSETLRASDAPTFRLMAPPPPGALGSASVLSLPIDGTPPPRDPEPQTSGCETGRGSYVLEVVPVTDGETRRMVLRAVPRP